MGPSLKLCTHRPKLRPAPLCNITTELTTKDISVPIFTHLSASFPGPPALTSLSDVKTRVMDVTLDDFAYLAHYLGYGWCGGCQGQWVGEDFVRSADSWHSNKIRNCGGYKSDHRLSLHYENFKFGVKDIKYGKAVIQVSC